MFLVINRAIIPHVRIDFRYPRFFMKKLYSPPKILIIDPFSLNFSLLLKQIYYQTYRAWWHRKSVDLPPNDMLLLYPWSYQSFHLFLPFLLWKIIQFWWHLYLAISNKIKFLQELVNECSKLSCYPDLHKNLANANHHINILLNLLYLDKKCSQAFSCCNRILECRKTSNYWTITIT